MDKKKIVDLAEYRRAKTLAGKDSDPLKKDALSFEEKLQELIHRPQPGSKSELIAIFEEEQQKKDGEGVEE